MTALVLVVAGALLMQAPPDPTAGAVILPNGLALPYPTVDVYRAFGRCKGGGRHHHEAVDLGGVGPRGGLGSAVRSVTRARVVEIALGRDDPVRFGAPDARDGMAPRNKLEFPRRLDIAGYGEVHFFTRRRGGWRTGNMVVTEGLEPPLEGYRIRYLHLGAVRPDLEVGGVLAAGEELGLLGGTGVQHDWPHVHIDVRDAEEQPVDIAPLIGLPRSATCGPAARRGGRDYRTFKRLARGIDWRPDWWAPPVGAPDRVPGAGLIPLPVDLLVSPPPLVQAGVLPRRSRVWRKRFGLGRCGRWREKDDFSTGAFDAHVFLVDLAAGQVVDATLVKLAGPVMPVLAVVDLEGKSLIVDGPEESDQRLRARIVSPTSTRALVTLIAPPPEVRRQVEYDLVVRDRCRAVSPAETPSDRAGSGRW